MGGSVTHGRTGVAQGGQDGLSFLRYAPGGGVKGTGEPMPAPPAGRCARIRAESGPVGLRARTRRAVSGPLRAPGWATIPRISGAPIPPGRRRSLELGAIHAAAVATDGARSARVGAGSGRRAAPGREAPPERRRCVHGPDLGDSPTARGAAACHFQNLRQRHPLARRHRGKNRHALRRLLRATARSRPGASAPTRARPRPRPLRAWR